jgi:hypothetical protein
MEFPNREMTDKSEALRPMTDCGGVRSFFNSSDSTCKGKLASKEMQREKWGEVEPKVRVRKRLKVTFSLRRHLKFLRTKSTCSVSISWISMVRFHPRGGFENHPVFDVSFLSDFSKSTLSVIL